MSTLSPPRILRQATIERTVTQALRHNFCTQPVMRHYHAWEPELNRSTACSAMLGLTHGPVHLEIPLDPLQPIVLAVVAICVAAEHKTTLRVPLPADWL